METPKIELTNDIITISRMEYDHLIQSDKWLQCLEAAGVDNWEGYEMAQDLYDSRYPEEEE